MHSNHYQMLAEIDKYTAAAWTNKADNEHNLYTTLALLLKVRPGNHLPAPISLKVSKNMLSKPPLQGERAHLHYSPRKNHKM